jgi:hypothetical protein
MMQAITTRMSALLLATVGVTLAGMIVTFGGSLVVLGLLQTANSSSYASVQTTSAPFQIVDGTSPLNNGRVQNP